MNKVNAKDGVDVPQAAKVAEDEIKTGDDKVNQTAPTGSKTNSRDSGSQKRDSQESKSGNKQRKCCLPLYMRARTWLHGF